MATNKTGRPAFISNADTIDRLLSFEPSSFNAAVNRSVERYLVLVQVGNREIRKAFTDAELYLITDVCNGTSFDPFSLAVENNLIAMSIEDAFQFSPKFYGSKWNVDEQELLVRIRQLSIVGQIALLQFLETYWQGDFAQIGQVFQV